MASTWGWISRRREQEILELEIRHLSKILEVAEASLDLVDSLLRGGDVEEAYRRVKEAERAADRVKDEIVEDLSRGIFHPIDREELLRLVLTGDDIADHLNAGSRRLLILARVEPETLPQEVLNAIRDIAGKARESIGLLIDAVKVLRRDPRRATELAQKVERLEEEADEARSRAEEELVRWCNTVAKPGSCVTLHKALESFETATDKCEDTGDVVRSIAILSG